MLPADTIAEINMNIAALQLEPPPTLLSGLVHRLDHAPDDHWIG